MQRKRGSTSNMIRVFIQANDKTDGSGLTGLTNASTNLNIATHRELDTTLTVYSGANIEAQTTVGTYQAPSTSSKIRFKEVDATNAPGEYELQFHDSAAGAFGSGDTSRYMQVYIREVTTTALKIAPCLKEVDLTATDVQDGTSGGITVLTELNGLLGQNSGLRNAVYTGTNLTSYDLCLYDSAAHATTNDGATGLLHKYSVVNTYNGSGNILTSVTTRIS